MSYWIVTAVIFTWPLLLLGVCCATVYVGMKIFKINKDEPTEFNGYSLSFAMSIGGISIAALIISLIIAFIIGLNVPYLSDAFNEWGLAQENAYLQATILLIIWMILYICLQIPSYFIFRKRIVHPLKRRKLFLVYLLISSIVCLIPLCLIYI